MGAQPIVVFAAALNRLKVDFFPVCSADGLIWPLQYVSEKQKRHMQLTGFVVREGTRNTILLSWVRLFFSLFNPHNHMQSRYLSGEPCFGFMRPHWYTPVTHWAQPQPSSTVPQHSLSRKRKNPPRIMLSLWDFFFNLLFCVEMKILSKVLCLLLLCQPWDHNL